MADQVPVRLDDLLEAARSSSGSDEPLDHLVGHFVDQARRAGASWTDIGGALGVSKQAAQQRFVARAAVDADAFTGPRFARFTPRAREAVVRAASHAAAAGAGSVEPEHVLLGLLDDPGSLATRALEVAGAPADRLRERLAVASAATGAGGGHLPFTNGSKLLLERTLRESLRLGHNYVGTEHVLLALLDDEGAAGAAIREAGVGRPAIESWVVRQLQELMRQQ